MLHRFALRAGTSCQEKLPAGVVVVHRAPNDIPDPWHLLPFVDQQRSQAPQQYLRISGDRYAHSSWSENRPADYPLIRKG